MKLSDLEEIEATQKAALEEQVDGIARRILPELPDIQGHALVVSGIRRCGKSTLLRQFVRKLERSYFYLNFDDIRLASFTYADFGLLDRVIESSGARLLFFDEIQSADQWELYIRQKLDEGFQVVVTGSNASLLSRELGSRLTGRHLSVELFPFSYGEFCSFTGQVPGAESLNDYLTRGGFPEYLKTGNLSILSQLQSDILYRDIAVRYGIRDVTSLRRLFVYLVSNPAQLFSPSKLTQTAGVKSSTTILEYISFFEAAYLIHILPCFAWSVKAQSLAPKKVYIADPGIIASSSLSFSSNLGALLESFVFNSLRQSMGKEGDLYYFSDKSGGECDFVVSPYSNPSCVQVCWELSPDNQEREINGLIKAMDFFNQEKGTIITFNTEDTIQIAGKRIDVIPAWKKSCFDRR
ncbi:MAG: ATP-binding protein [Spirochaetaceae bacterium]|jgi:predicted AAA+ superfamily ATPase|nr:ATP-binding protein [Spirochaetaceae bacterium]